MSSAVVELGCRDASSRPGKRTLLLTRRRRSSDYSAGHLSLPVGSDGSALISPDTSNLSRRVAIIRPFVISLVGRSLSGSSRPAVFAVNASSGQSFRLF